MLDAFDTPPHDGISQRAASARTARFASTGLMVSLRPLAQARGLVPQWEALARRALDPNIYYEAAFALPAAEPFGDNVMVAAVHAPDDTLIALWPFRLARARWGVPLPVLLGWTHPFAALGVPLIDADRASDALLGLLNLPGAFNGLPRRVLLPRVPEAGRFADLLDSLTATHGLRDSRSERHDRPELHAGTDPLAHFSSGTKAKLRQEQRRLEKLGDLRFEQVTDSALISEALDDYLYLEAKGWKGRAGTAIPQSPTQTNFMISSTVALAAQGRVRIDRLRLGETTIASSITYFAGATAWYAKISYNEDYAKNSPGSHLVLKATESLLADPAVARVDSCAPPLHPLMRKFWPDRFWLANRLLELPGGDPLFPVAAALERARPVVRDKINALRHRSAQGKRSATIASG